MSRSRRSSNFYVCFLLLLTAFGFFFALLATSGQGPVSYSERAESKVEAYMRTVVTVPPEGESGQTSQLEKTKTDVTPVVLFAYQRGGSSFIGSILSQLEESFYWFEPLKGPLRDLYGEPKEGVISLPLQYSVWRNGTIRSPPPYEMKALANEINHIMNCDLSDLSMKTLGHHGYIHASPHLASYHNCYKVEGLRRELDCTGIETDLCPNMAADYTSQEAYVCRQRLQKALSGNLTKTSFDLKRLEGLRQCQKRLWGIIQQCLPKVQSRCAKSYLRAVKVIRITMGTLRHVLIKHPNTLIIHLLRDPRGIIRSRMNLNYIRSNMKISDEARDLCAAMLEDVKIRHQLEHEFPDNFLTVRYEDAATDPVKTAEAILSRLKRDMSQDFRQNLMKMVQSKVDRGEPFGVARTNGTATANAWRNMSAYVLRAIDIRCRELYKATGYKETFGSEKGRGSFRKETAL